MKNKNLIRKELEKLKKKKKNTFHVKFNDKKIIEALGELKDVLGKFDSEADVEHLKGIKDTLDRTEERESLKKFPTELDVVVKNQQEEVSIKNFPEPVKEVELIQPKWWKFTDNLPIIKEVSNGISQVISFLRKEKIKVNLDSYKLKKNAIAVNVVKGGGGGAVAIPAGQGRYIPKVVLSNQKVVATAGTAVPLQQALGISSITIQALSTNSVAGIIYVGNGSVNSANGYELSSGSTVSVDINDSSKVYIDASVNGEGVSWIVNK